jgi:predicted aspartyl protease
MPQSAPAVSPELTSVPFVQVGNAAVVQVRLGSLGSQPFIIDTGADELSIDAKTADDLLARNEAKELSPQNSVLADGSVKMMRRIRVGGLTLGGRTVANVDAAVTEHAMPLLGTNVLKEFGTFTIDTVNNKLVLGSIKPMPTPPMTAATITDRTASGLY